MAIDDREQLVQQITQAVIAALGRQGDASPHSPREQPAAVRQVAGDCSGNAQPRGIGIPGPSAALAGIITASQLQAAMDAAADGVARIADDARLSPLANDLARQHPQRVRRVSRQQRAADSRLADGMPWLWWAEHPMPAVTDMIEQQADRWQPVGVQAPGGRSLLEVVEHVGEAVRDRRAHGAVLLVDCAAEALCLVNRCRLLRGVAGVDIQMVRQGVDRIGANVLILEPSGLGLSLIQQMMQLLTHQPPRSRPMFERALAQAHRLA